MLERLTAAGFRCKHDHTFVDLGDVTLVQLLYEPPDLLLDIQLDIQIAKAAYQQQPLARAVPFDLPDGPTMKAIACEDLILLKLLAGRVIDRVDAAALLRANIDDIDLGYLLHWAKELNLVDALRDIWAEALPQRPWPSDQ